MKNRRVRIFAFAAFIWQLSTSLVFAQSSVSTQQSQSISPIADRLIGFDEELEKIRKDWNVPGMAMVIVKGDQVLYARGHGLRDVARQLPMTADTLLPIGSSTKSFTTATIASLVDEGKLDWNKPVKTWLPTFQMYDSLATERVSLLDMVTHRTGLPRHDLVWYNEPKLTLATLTRRLRYLEPSKDFRTLFQYNNLMFVAAGHATEVVCSQPWQDCVRDRLLRPLGMTRSNYDLASSQSDGNFSVGYRSAEDGALQVMPYNSIQQIAPAGGINSSVNEMAAWLQMHLSEGQFRGKQILTSKSVEFLHTPQVLSDDDITEELVPTGYAPGWFTGVYRGHRRLEHSGIIDGFASAMVLLPDDQIGIMVLANLYLTNAHHYAARAAADRLLQLPRVDWSARGLERLAKGGMHHMAPESPESRVEATRPSHALREFSGVFEHPAYGVVTINEQHGKLSFDFHGVVTPLQHWHYDVFVGEHVISNPKFQTQRVQFNTAPNGHVNALQMDLENGVQDIVFTRRLQ